MFLKLKYIVGQKPVLIGSSIVFVVFMVGVLPWINYLNGIYIGVSLSPDTSLFYSPSAFYQMLFDYGDDGRRFYILIRWTFDLIYPLVYGLFLMVVLVRINKEHFKNYLILFPLLGVVFDYLENTFATLLMGLYPSQFSSLVYILEIMSILKWLFIGLSMYLIVFKFVSKVYSRFLHKT